MDPRVITAIAAVPDLIKLMSTVADRYMKKQQPTSAPVPATQSQPIEETLDSLASRLENIERYISDQIEVDRKLGEIQSALGAEVLHQAKRSNIAIVLSLCSLILSSAVLVKVL